MNCLLKCYLCVFTGAGSLNAHSLTCCYTSPSQCRCQAVEFTFKSKNNVGLQTITLTPVPFKLVKNYTGTQHQLHVPFCVFSNCFIIVHCYKYFLIISFWFLSFKFFQNFKINLIPETSSLFFIWLLYLDQILWLNTMPYPRFTIQVNFGQTLSALIIL